MLQKTETFPVCLCTQKSSLLQKQKMSLLKEQGFLSTSQHIQVYRSESNVETFTFSVLTLDLLLKMSKSSSMPVSSLPLALILDKRIFLYLVLASQILALVYRRDIVRYRQVKPIGRTWQCDMSWLVQQPWSCLSFFFPSGPCFLYPTSLLLSYPLCSLLSVSYSYMQGLQFSFHYQAGWISHGQKG